MCILHTPHKQRDDCMPALCAQGVGVYTLKLPFLTNSLRHHPVTTCISAHTLFLNAKHAADITPQATYCMHTARSRTRKSHDSTSCVARMHSCRRPRPPMLRMQQMQEAYKVLSACGQPAHTPANPRHPPSRERRQCHPTRA